MEGITGEAATATEADELADVAAEPPKPATGLHKWGIIGSVVWVTSVALYATVLDRTEFLAMKPNEYGDFFAGAFAPLAFLWLVLGFFQQGEELRNSANALWLQGRELQNSVEQQRELVKATRESLAFEREMLAAEREEATRNARPIITLVARGTTRSGGKITSFGLSLANHGKPCTDLRADFAGVHPRVKKGLFDRGDYAHINLTVPPEGLEPFAATVSYIDERLMPGEATFLITQVGERLIIRET